MNNFKSLFFLTAMIFSYATNAQDWVSYQSPQQINDLVDNGSELIMATDAGLVVMNLFYLKVFLQFIYQILTSHV